MGVVAEQLSSYIRLSCITGIAFTVLWLVTGTDGAPQGNLFAITCIYVAALVGGAFVSDLGLRLPPLLGMLIMGFLLTNLPKVGEYAGGKAVDHAWSKSIRDLALTMILCRAGLGLDVDSLLRLRWTVAKLAILPSTLEAVAVACMAKLFLGFTWPWAGMLGYVVAPISPAVVIPSVLALQDQGYGSTTGIPSMMVAAAALDDVLSLAGFGIFKALSFPKGGVSGGQEQVPLWFTICSAPINYALGIVAGLIAGWIMSLLLPKEEEYSPWWRAGWLLCLAVVLMQGLTQAGLEGASCLGVLIMCVVVVKSWGAAVSKPVTGHFTEMWNNLAQPLLFGLVGADVVVNDLKGKELMIALGILTVSLTWRLLVTVVSVSGQGLRWQEQVFVSVGWLPKATVQAAIGHTACTLASPEEMPNAHLIFTISVVAILLTAPAGAAIISTIGPVLLQKDKEEEADGVGAPIIIPDLPSIRGALLSTDLSSVRGVLKAADRPLHRTSLTEPIIEHWMDIFN
eukprot:CAMPEP_0194477458 /NCGR_PEP_ID=MMETSP0253-20130528/1198_1 /TAXON_ID=2966 /ORGANISM="Noctiluca scintillans" /LENGTH=511 /DNA_ID=CAMNT_0039316437 /DNA_START=76 /DNA_END=1611 /DNA_ORIENTATION=+